MPAGRRGEKETQTELKVWLYEARGNICRGNPKMAGVKYCTVLYCTRTTYCAEIVRLHKTRMCVRLGESKFPQTLPAPRF